MHLATRHQQFDEQAALKAVLAAHPRLAFQPGSKYAYSNIGYWLLGQLVERVVSNNSIDVLARAIERACEMCPGLLATRGRSVPLIR